MIALRRVRTLLLLALLTAMLFGVFVPTVRAASMDFRYPPPEAAATPPSLLLAVARRGAGRQSRQVRRLHSQAVRQPDDLPARRSRSRIGRWAREHRFAQPISTWKAPASDPHPARQGAARLPACSSSCRRRRHGWTRSRRWTNSNSSSSARVRAGPTYACCSSLLAGARRRLHRCFRCSAASADLFARGTIEIEAGGAPTVTTCGNADRKALLRCTTRCRATSSYPHAEGERMAERASTTACSACDANSNLNAAAWAWKKLVLGDLSCPGGRSSGCRIRNCRRRLDRQILVGRSRRQVGHRVGKSSTRECNEQDPRFRRGDERQRFSALAFADRIGKAQNNFSKSGARSSSGGR